MIQKIKTKSEIHFSGTSPGLLLILLSSLFAPGLFCQEDEITNNSFFFPNVMRESRVIQTIGLSTAELPEDLVETTDILRSPLFFYKIRYNLPADFTLEAGAESNIITYRFSLAPGFGYNYQKYGFAAAADVIWLAGRLKQEDFNTEIYGWSVYPNFSAGYKFPHFTLTLKMEFMLMLNQVSKIESIKENITGDTFTGYSFGLYLEQPLWKDHYLVLGVKSYFTKFYSPLWAAFPTFDRYVYISELIFGYNL